MNEDNYEPTEPSQPEADPRILRHAARIWRKAAVRPADRRVLLAELSAELTAAGAAGLPASTVIGEDPEHTLRAWADERGLSGRSLRVLLVVPATMVGIAVGFAVQGAVLFIEFTRTTTAIWVIPPYVILGLYAVTALLAYLLAVNVTFMTLRQVRDPRSGSTAKWLAAILPAGAAVATAAGVGVARALGFTTEPGTFVAVITVVSIVLAATATFARYFATRPRTAVTAAS
ncbi:hypothetical protein [Rhodococcus xishaensis]|uniref:Uncharacterized protein n=1 Tax=Rhodococcus xishaensis TaxID=2487364 RepID=A0A3S3E2S5_9NOCA|nr:hypothetical protein [Rhodococcus xishaensis]RVW03996.1 hypothetical protein EGT50_05715 [Rhodococcus xishaensis]